MIDIERAGHEWPENAVMYVIRKRRERQERRRVLLTVIIGLVILAVGVVWGLLL